jgi:hypothetical protein
MKKKYFKTIENLKVFQLLLAFICVSYPIMETQAILGFFKKKKKPPENNKYINSVIKDKKLEKNSIGANDRKFGKIKKTNKKSKKTANHHRFKKSIPTHSKRQEYTSLSTSKLQIDSNKNVDLYLKKNNINIKIEPPLTSMRNNSAEAMKSALCRVLPLSMCYDYPTSNREIVTVPLKKVPDIESSGKEFINQVSLFLADPQSNPKLESFANDLERYITCMKKEKTILKKELIEFMELHKKYHDPKKCVLNFEQSNFDVLLDSSKKIMRLIQGVKKNGDHDHMAQEKYAMLKELNTIENILGYEKTKEKIETVQVKKVTYERPAIEAQGDQHKDDMRQKSSSSLYASDANNNASAA